MATKKKPAPSPTKKPAPTKAPKGKTKGKK